MKDIFANLYNKVMSFFHQTDTTSNAKDVACSRLKLVLMQDRTNLTPAIMDRMRRELVELLSKYVELDKELLELNFEQEDNQMALMLSIPVIRAKDEKEIQEILDKEDEERKKLEESAEEEEGSEEDEENIDEEESSDENEPSEGETEENSNDEAENHTEIEHTEGETEGETTSDIANTENSENIETCSETDEKFVDESKNSDEDIKTEQEEKNKKPDKKKKATKKEK